MVKKIKAKEAKRQEKAKALPSPPSSTATDRTFEDLSTASTPLGIVREEQSSLSIAFTLSHDIEYRAINVFNYNYVLGPNGASLTGSLERLAELSRCHCLDDWVLAAMKAVGLATLAFSSNAPSVLNNARYQYMRAIQLTNEALRNPEDVNKV